MEQDQQNPPSRRGPGAALAVIAAAAVAIVAGGIDLPPWLQTVLTVGGLLALAAPYVGQLMVASNPASVWGRRFMLGGVWLRALASKPKVYAALPAPIRVVMTSLPEIDPADLPLVQAAAKESERTGQPVVVQVVAEEKPSRPPPPAGPLVTMLLALALAGCHDLSPAVATANATREVGHATAAQLRELCTVPYERAAEMPLAEAGREVIRLNRMGCPRAARAHDALRAAHRTLVGVITAIDAGQCDSVVSRRPAECDLAGAVREVIDASAEMALAVDALWKEQPR